MMEQQVDIRGKENSVQEFINNMSANMAGVSSQDYVSQEESMLGKLDKLDAIVKKYRIPVAKEGIVEGKAIKSAISSLSCYAFNNNKAGDIRDRIYALEGEMGRKMATFCRSLTLKIPKEVKPVIRYILWGTKTK